MYITLYEYVNFGLQNTQKINKINKKKEKGYKKRNS